jgi:nucleotide-binding universal stress UspA family protein
MIDWKRICCAVDFEAPSRMAMESAADLAKRLEAELTLVHVVAPPPPLPSDAIVVMRGEAGDELDEADETLARWRVEAEARSGRPVHAVVVTGDPVEEILRQVHAAGSDLLVLGTHGRTGIARLAIGSVAERVARRSPCPVLLFRDHAAREKAELAEELSQYA